ncbi:AEC family transporter [uncultured Oxalicibacterium sp.]|uniref:AEC family transporter n=1 Tax=uncultured Oxalicibacterium sp. TaxID=1168540 RepID=UPI0025DABF19|nr:AEC family transporter [uncultured Oxalicibacterium sp.]
MHIVNLLLPDFLLILFGALLIRVTKWGTPFWEGMEKMIYYILFPALLFYSTARSPIDFSKTGTFLQIALAACISGIVFGWFAKPLFKAKPMMFESGVQTAFRFNSYIALAIASRLGGPEGTSLMGLIIGFAVPLCNMAAVHALVKDKGGLLLELLKNPLLVATLSGVLFNLAGLHLPELASAFLSRLGNASIALGLIMVGAGLRMTGLHESKGIAAWFLTVKLLVVPAITYGLGIWAGLSQEQLTLVVMFAALPTASSCYVLAVRMGGNGPFTAFLISASTLLSMASLPLWLALLQ